MQNVVKQVQGWTLPDDDVYFTKYLQDNGGRAFQIDHLEAALGFVQDWEWAIDLGAHVGFWTRTLAERFQHVWAVEADATNYECLVANMTGHKSERVDFTRAAVWSESSPGMKARVVRDVSRVGNTGSHFIALGGPGTVPLVTVDTMPMRDDEDPSVGLGLVKIDLEGAEYYALLGAERTIRSHRPVIIMETDKPFAQTRFGVPDDAAVKLLESWGYKRVAHMRPDAVFAHP